MDLTLIVQCRGLRFDEGVLNGTNGFKGKDRSVIQRTWHRFLPSLQHGLHAASGHGIDQSVRFHKCAVEVAAEVDSVWSSHVLDDTIQDIEGG